MGLFGKKRIAQLEGLLRRKNEELDQYYKASLIAGNFNSGIGAVVPLDVFIADQADKIQSLEAKEAERKKKKKRKAKLKLKERYDAEYKQLSAAIKIGDKFTYCDAEYWCKGILSDGRPEIDYACKNGTFMDHCRGSFTVDDLPLITDLEKLKACFDDIGVEYAIVTVCEEILVSGSSDEDGFDTTVCLMFDKDESYSGEK